MLKGIEFARRRDWPFLAHLRRRFSTPSSNSPATFSASPTRRTAPKIIPDRKNIVIYPVACAVPDRKGNAPKLSGVVPEIRLRPGSYLQSFYGEGQRSRQRRILLQLRSQPGNTNGPPWKPASPWSPAVPKGEIRAIESPTHRFCRRHTFSSRNYLPPKKLRIP